MRGLKEVEGGIRISRRKVGGKGNVTELYYQYYLLDYLLWRLQPRKFLLNIPSGFIWLSHIRLLLFDVAGMFIYKLKLGVTSRLATVVDISICNVLQIFWMPFFGYETNS